MADFIGLAWPLGWFLVAVVVSIALAWFYPMAGFLAFSAVWFLGADWELAKWLVWVFVITWLLGLVAVVIFYISGLGYRIAISLSGLTVVLVVVMLLASVSLGGYTADSGTGASGTSTSSPTSSPSTSTTTTTSTVTVTASPSSQAFNSQVWINQMFGKGMPFEGMKDQVRVGPKVDFRVNPEERGLAAFSRKTLKTQQDIAQYLNGSSAESRATNARVVSAITSAGYGMDEVNRALDGSGYFPVQMTVAAQILGTTYFHNGKVLEDGQWRTVGPNDIFWLFMTRDGKIIFGAAIRADCANVNLTKVRPIQPSTPPAPSVECSTGCKPSTPSPTPSTHTTTTPSKTTTTTTPSTHTSTTTTQTCLSKYGPGYSGTYPNCHKDGSASVQPTQPSSAPGTNPPPVVVTKTGTPQPTSAQCYDPVTGDPVPSGTQGAWCS